MALYVVARSLTTKRPMCQHIVARVKSDTIFTECGRAVVGRSSEYTDLALNSIMCQRCKKKEEKA